MVAALQLDGSETVVDLGCGSRYFTFRFAKALPNGKVVALDHQPDGLRRLFLLVTLLGILLTLLVSTSEPWPLAGSSVAEERYTTLLLRLLAHVELQLPLLTRLGAEAPQLELAQLGDPRLETNRYVRLFDIVGSG